MKVNLEKIHDDAQLPEYSFKDDAGMDIKAYGEHILKPGERELIGTGIKIALPKTLAGFIYPRSGLALKKGVTVLNADGVIDPNYRGELKVLLINHGEEELKIEHGDRIAQLIIHKIYHIVWNETDSLRETKREAGGFGHTGT